MQHQKIKLNANVSKLKIKCIITVYPNAIIGECISSKQYQAIAIVKNSSVACNAVKPPPCIINAINEVAARLPEIKAALFIFFRKERFGNIQMARKAMFSPMGAIKREINISINVSNFG